MKFFRLLTNVSCSNWWRQVSFASQSLHQKCCENRVYLPFANKFQIKIQFQILAWQLICNSNAEMWKRVGWKTQREPKLDKNRCCPHNARSFKQHCAHWKFLSFYWIVVSVFMTETHTLTIVRCKIHTVNRSAHFHVYKMQNSRKNVLKITPFGAHTLPHISLNARTPNADECSRSSLSVFIVCDVVQISCSKHQQMNITNTHSHLPRCGNDDDGKIHAKWRTNVNF